MQSAQTLACSSPVRCVRFDASGRFLGVLAGAEQQLSIYRFDGDRFQLHGRLGTSVSADVPIASITFHPNQPVLAHFGEDQPISLWNIEESARILEIPTRPELKMPVRPGYWGVCFSSDGRFIEAYGLGTETGFRYHLGGTLAGTRFGRKGPLTSFSTSPLMIFSDVREMGTAFWFGQWADEQMRWHAVELFAWFPSTRIALGPQAIAFIGGSGATHVQVHDFPTCKVRFAVDLDLNPEDVEFPWGVSEALAFHPDGHSLFAPSATGEVIVLDALTGDRQRGWRCHNGLVTTLDVHPSLPILASGGADGNVSILRHEADASWPAMSTNFEMSEFVERFPFISESDPTKAEVTEIEP
jgi:WD40 repeat protein